MKAKEKANEIISKVFDTMLSNKDSKAKMIVYSTYIISRYIVEEIQKVVTDIGWEDMESGDKQDYWDDVLKAMQSF